MVEAGSNLKLLPSSILHIYKVFEHIDMLSIGIGIQQQPYTIIHLTWLSSDYGVLAQLSQHDVILSWLRQQPPQTASTIHLTHLQSA